jgi:hypothetical protein
VFRFALLLLVVTGILGSLQPEPQKQATKNTQQLATGEARQPATLSDVSWLRGEWIGEGLGGQADEIWSAPMAGTMVGTFRLVNEGKLVFSEFFMLVEEQKSLTLKLKHFDSKMKGWEEKEKFTEFKLIKVEHQTAWFDGLTYRLDKNNVLHAYVAMKQKDGSLQEGEFVFRKRPPAPTRETPRTKDR